MSDETPADHHRDPEHQLARSRRPSIRRRSRRWSRRRSDARRPALRSSTFHGEKYWTEAIDALRAETDLILQCGMSSLPIPERMEVFEKRADMISIIVSHHDEAFVELDVHVLHPREELTEYADLSRRHGVKLELETWHTGSIWNIEWMIERDLLDPPYFTSIFFGWPGGSWSPATIEEYLHRRRNLPADCIATVSAMGPDQFRLLVNAIALGDHVRVGTEDYPFDLAGKPAGHQRAGRADRGGRQVDRPPGRHAAIRPGRSSESPKEGS